MAVAAICLANPGIRTGEVVVDIGYGSCCKAVQSKIAFDRMTTIAVLCYSASPLTTGDHSCRIADCCMTGQTAAGMSRIFGCHMQIKFFSRSAHDMTVITG